MADYSFLSVWQLEAPIESVWAAISQEQHYPEWWPYVAHVEQVNAGDADRVGAASRMHWTTALSFSFVFSTRTTRSRPPNLLELSSTGELEGQGRWELAEDDGVTTVRYYWTVRTTELWINLLAPLARPAFAWNHAIIMRAGGEGLARRLSARLVGNHSYTEESTNPLPPLLNMAGLIVLGIAAVRRGARLL